jgi:hypothetical protein
MGYVTLPRRPRGSWSAPPQNAVVPPPSPAPSLPLPEAVYGELGKFYKIRRHSEVADPVYDRLGPRTSADGTLPRPGKKKKTTTTATGFVGGGVGSGDQRVQGKPDVQRNDLRAKAAEMSQMTAEDYGAFRRGFHYSTLPRAVPAAVAETSYSPVRE